VHVAESSVQNNDVGAIDLAFDPTSLAGHLRRPLEHPSSALEHLSPSYGPGSGLYKSTDGGCELAAADQRSAGRRPRPHRYCGGAGEQPPRVRDRGREGRRLFRSDDAGGTWSKTSTTAASGAAAGTFGKIAVDPKNPDLVYVSNTGVYRSRDGGRTFGEPFKGSPGGDDYHQLWIYPDDGSRMILAAIRGR